MEKFINQNYRLTFPYQPYKVSLEDFQMWRRLFIAWMQAVMLLYMKSRPEDKKKEDK